LHFLINKKSYHLQSIGLQYNREGNTTGKVWVMFLLADLLSNL